MDAADLAAFDEDSAVVGEALWAGRVRIGGVEYPASSTPPRVEGELDGGEVLSGERVIRLRKSVHAAVPPVNAEASWINGDGVESKWRIRSVVGDSPSSAIWTLRCDPNN